MLTASLKELRDTTRVQLPVKITNLIKAQVSRFKKLYKENQGRPPPSPASAPLNGRAGGGGRRSGSSSTLGAGVGVEGQRVFPRKRAASESHATLAASTGRNGKARRKSAPASATKGVKGVKGVGLQAGGAGGDKRGKPPRSSSTSSLDRLCALASNQHDGESVKALLIIMWYI